MFWTLVYYIVNMKATVQAVIYVGILFAYVALETSLDTESIETNGSKWLWPLVITGWGFCIWEGFIEPGESYPMWLWIIDGIFAAISVMFVLPNIKRFGFIRGLLMNFVKMFGIFLLGVLLINVVSQLALFLGLLLVGAVCLALFAFSK